MTKEELKQEAEQDAGNASGLDLSTTLMVAKDKTDAYRLGRFDGYISSAEPREKRIAELEESNKEWQRTCDAKSDTNSQLIEQLADKVEKIAELEKENAELKSKLATEKRLTTMQDETVVSMTNNLTKAKELLRYYFDCFKNDNKYTLSDFEVVEDTEQFLKDSEVEK